MGHIPYHRVVKSASQLLESSRQFYEELKLRRSVRFFGDKDVSREVIENLLRTAGSAPSGANKQPWHFVAVSNPALKSKIREAAEEEEKAFYEERATVDWLEDLKPIGTDWQKPFLEIAPWLIVVFKKTYDDTPEGRKKNYYVQESVGFACVFLISAIHEACLVTFTHTTSPINFLS